MNKTTPEQDNPGYLSLFIGRRKTDYSTQTDPTITDGKPTVPFPYKVNHQFLSQDELDFYLLAREILSGKYIICPKVALAELISVTTNDARLYQMAVNKIMDKRIDFVVCDSATMRPVYAIELNDVSRENPDWQEHIEFIDRVFKALRFPLLRMDCKNGCSEQEMIERLLTPLQPRSTPPPLQGSQYPDNDVSPQTTVVCTKCGAPMRKIAATAGPHLGEYYWVCSNRPNCQNFYPAGERKK